MKRNLAVPSTTNNRIFEYIITVFNDINNIEIEIASLLKNLSKLPNLKICNTIEIKAQLAHNKFNNISHLIPPLHSTTIAKGELNYRDTYDAKMVFYSNQENANEAIIINLEFAKMMNAIDEMVSKAKETVEVNATSDLDALQALELSSMPNINFFVQSTISQLTQALKQSDLSEEAIKTICEHNIDLLAKTLYSAEEKSLATKKFQGVLGHYFSLMNENNLLHEEVKKLQSGLEKQESDSTAKVQETTRENEQLNAQIQQLQREKAHYLTQGQEEALNNLREKNRRLRGKIHKLEMKVNNEDNPSSHSYRFHPG